MNQVVQNYRSGELTVTEVPAPAVRPGSVLVAVAASLVSVGTEKAMIDVAKKSLVGKALARPDWVKQVLDKVRTEGIGEAWRQAFARLDMPVPLGYASAGVVLEVGSAVRDFIVGDRVACSGSGHASHAEVAAVPANLCTPIPEGVGYDAAAFAALGGIALEAVRMAQVELGHRVAVIGLGLLGQLAVQLLDAAGCHVLGIDISLARNQLARDHGAEITAPGDDAGAAIAACQAFTQGQGVDAVIILASTPSNEPLELAAALCRERGRVVATGLVGLEIPRQPFYEKELELIVSRAWGPGMYDPDYEEHNVKYPLPYVRWTAQRNMAEFLAQVAKGSVRLDQIITHRFPFDRALEAYEMILEHKAPCMGVVLEYPLDQELARSTRIDLKPPAVRSRSGSSDAPIGIGLIGAGLYARGTLLPALAKIKGVRKVGVATRSGLSGRHVGDKFGFGYCTTDYRQLLDDPNVQAVFVLTRHGSHARFVCDVLQAGKAVFVEKPLALNEAQLAEVVRAHGGRGYLMVGFNRRFAPDTQFVTGALRQVPGPYIVYCRSNAGAIPAESWVHQPDEGGGRIIGEGCHFVDLANGLTGSVPTSVHAIEARTSEGLRDNLVVSLQMADGSAATITYASTGDKAFPREYVEVFGGGMAAAIDNFKGARVTSGGKMRRRRAMGVDRGHVAELQAFIGALRRGDLQPVPLRDYVATTLATFAIEAALTQGCAQPVDADGFIGRVMTADGADHE